MKKFILDLTVTENIRLNANYVLLKLTSQSLLPEMLPGQFAELRVDGSPTTFLRRPISINFVDKQRNEVWFLIQLVGDGTRRLAEVNPGETINVVPVATKICCSWKSLPNMERYIPPRKMVAMEKKDMLPNILY